LFETNVQTLMFSFYCNSGLLGIGPGMLDMRVNGAGALAPFAIPIAICGVFLFVVAVGGLLEVGKALPLPAVALLIACIFAPVAFTIMLGFLVHWRVLPRHLIPLVPLFSLLYAFGFAWWWRRRPTGRAIVLITVMIMAYSSLSVRFSPRQAKDDYRHAAELSAAELSHGGRVWWAADLWGARYYHIPYASGQLAWPDVADAGRVQGFLGAPPSILETLPAPSLVLLSKPELFDPDNRVQDYLTASHYRVVEVFPAFTAWRP
jgi:hypothetical protein